MVWLLSGLQSLWVWLRSLWVVDLPVGGVESAPSPRPDGQITLANQSALPLTVRVAASSQCTVQLSAERLPVQGTVDVALHALVSPASFGLLLSPEGAEAAAIEVAGWYDGQWQVATTVHDRTLAVGDPAPPVVFRVQQVEQDSPGVVGSSGWLELELLAAPGADSNTYPPVGVASVRQTQITLRVPIACLGSVDGKTLVQEAGLVPKDHWKGLGPYEAWITATTSSPPPTLSGYWDSSPTWEQIIEITLCRWDDLRFISNAEPLRVSLLMAPRFSGDLLEMQVDANYWIGQTNHNIERSGKLLLTRSSSTLTGETLVLPIFPATTPRAWQQIGKGTLGGVAAGVYRSIAALQPPLLLLADVDGQGIPQALAEAELAWRPVSYLWLDNTAHLDDPALAAAVCTAAALKPTPSAGGFTVPRLVWAVAKAGGLDEIRRIDVQFDPRMVDGYPVTAVDVPLAGRLSLFLQHDCTLVEEPGAFRFTSTQDRFSGLGVQVVAAAEAAGGSGPALELGLSAGLSLAAEGVRSGGLAGGLWIAQGPLLFELGAEIRSARWAGSAWEVATYPLQDFLEEEDIFAFQLQLDPLHLFDPSRTRFDFDPEWQDGAPNPEGEGKINDCRFDTFRRTSGAAVALRPAYDLQTPSGFALAASPLVVRADTGVAVHDTPDVYLTPNGTFHIEGSGALELMGGTSGTEYFFLSGDGALVFHPGSEAEAGVLAGGTHHGADRWTTAWTEVQVASGGTVRWCTQALSTTQYVRQASLPGDILAAASPQLAEGAPLGPFPALPQGGVYEQIQRSGWDPQIPTDGELPLTALEAHAAAWATGRRHQLVGAHAFPVLLEPDHSGPKAGNRSRTPQGLVADLNDGTGHALRALQGTGSATTPPAAGSWKVIRLATSGDGQDTQSLNIQADPANGRVNDQLAVALANGDGVIAVGDLATYFYPAGADGSFKLGDFTYETATSKVAILKLDHRHSLAELVQEASWQPKVLGGDAATARQALLDLHTQATASDEASKSFAFFLAQVWSLPAWTGLLFVDLAIDQQDLPASVQMLLGGMEQLTGGLHAQVFGLTLNRVDNAGLDGAAPMKASSMFSVIFYQDASYLPPPLAQAELKFAVTLFAAVTVNSKLAALEAKVDMTVPELWGIPVSLDPPGPNGSPTFTLSGHRQDHPDGTASLVFAAPEASSFVPRADLQGVKILASFAVQDAALVPVGVAPTTKYLESAFDIAGDLSFDQEPLKPAGVPPLDHLDLFGFGGDHALPVPRYRVLISTEVPANGKATIQGYEEEVASIPVPPTAARPGSVADSLHLAVAAIEHDGGGFDGPHSWSLTFTTESGSPSYGGSTPSYALKLEVPIGPAGALSSPHDQKAGWLYLGWSAATTDGITTLAAGAVLDMNGVKLMLDGIIHSSWQQVDLVRVATTPPTPTLCFRKFQSSLFGLELINTLQDGLFPDLFLFGAADRKDLLWYRGPAPTNAHLGAQLPYYAVTRGALPAVSVTAPNPITASLKWARNNFGGAVSVTDFINRNLGAAKPSDIGLFVGVEADLLLARLGVVLDDAGLWGGLINIPKPLPPLAVLAAEALGIDGALEKLAGLLIEIAYRKVHDGLGVITVFFVPPGSPYAVQSAQIWAPSIGWSQWTNGDWQLAVGWPMDANPVKIQIPLGSFPFEGRFGLIQGEMHGSDGLLGGWAYADHYTISELGLGLALGVGKSGKNSGVNWTVSAVVQVTAQGFFASWTTDAWEVQDKPLQILPPTYDGRSLATYNWGTVTAGILLHGDFSLGFKLITISGSLDASLVATFVLETCHQTSIKLTLAFAVEVKIKLVCFTLHLDFRTTLTVGSWTTGKSTYPPALASGPTPRKLMSQGIAAAHSAAPLATPAAAAPWPVVKPLVKLPLTCRFAVQPFATVPDRGDPVPSGLALLGVTADDFARLVERFGWWILVSTWGSVPAHAKIADLLAALETALQANPFSADALHQSWVAGNLERGYAPATDAEQALTLLPLFTDLGIAVVGGPSWMLADFGDPLPANYPEIVAAYYGKQTLPTPAGQGLRMAEHLFEDGWNLLAQLLLAELGEIAGDADVAATADATWSALQAQLQGQPWSDALARLQGQISRHALSGTRLPDPSNLSHLVPLHQLSGQLVELQGATSIQLLTVERAPVRITPVARIELTAQQLHFDLGPADWTLQAAPALRQSDRIWQLGRPLAWAEQNLGDGPAEVFLLERGLARAAWARQAQPDCFTAAMPPDGGHLDLLTAKHTRYGTASLLALPLQLKSVKGTDGTYELAALGEAPRALLQSLLAGGAMVQGLALVEKTATTLTTLGGTPAGAAALTLVRANLSTSSRGPDAGAPPHLLGPNFAIVGPGASPADLTSFLTLVWETAVGQTGGFYLQGDSLVDAEDKALLLVVKAISWSLLANALMGELIPDGQQVYATLDLGDGGMLQQAGPAAPAGAVGWQAARSNSLDGTKLQDLYHTPVWRWRGATSEPEGRWSRPVHVNGTGGSMVYASAFAPSNESNGSRYAAEWSSVDVDLGLVDPVGNLVTGNALARLASGLAFPPDQRPVVLYNDAVLSLGQWPGCRPDYRVTAGPTLVLDLQFDAATLFPEVTDPSFAPAAQRTVDLWSVLWDQLHDPHLSVRIDSALGQIAEAGLKTSLQDALATCLQLAGKTIGAAGLVQLQLSGPVADCLWAGADGTAGTLQPLTCPLAAELPESWPALLAELTVAVVCERAEPGDGTVQQLQAEVYAADRAVRTASSLVPARQEMSDAPDFTAQDHSTAPEPELESQPAGLRKFALDLEAAYAGYAGAGSKLKLSVGTVSDPSDERFGQTALWLMRWGQPKGVTVTADAATASYSVPPPLSTRLWTGTAPITGFNPGVKVPHERPEVTFLAVDTDAWAASFLTTLESLFGPTVAPELAGWEAYDAVAQVKAGLAGSIAKNVLSIYTDGAQGDLTLSRAVMEQAVLRDLRQDYGTSTVLQVQTAVELAEPVEAGAPLPPQVFGPVHGTDASTTYSLTPAKLPLSPQQTAPWLTSLVHAVHPDAQRLLTVSPTFSVQFLEHLRHVVALPGDPGGYGYVPSAWLSFLLPEDPVLEASLGRLQIPIPLRRFPSRPKLLGQTAAPTHPQASTLGDALGWDYSVTLEKPLAAQDTLYLRIVFNEQLAGGFSAGTDTQTPLFQALADFHATWPELRPYLPGGGQPGHEAAALGQLQALLDAVNAGWQSWQVAATGTEPTPPATTYWEYALTWETTDGPPTVVPKTLDSPQPQVSGDNNATPTLTWKGLYVVDLQSARAYAWVTRNEEFEPGRTVNPAFVYATDPVRLPEPIVPLIEVPAPLTFDQPTAAGALTALLDELAEPGSYHQGRAEERQISYSAAISYSYRLLEDPHNAGAEVRPEHPLYLVTKEEPQQQPTASVPEVVKALADWQQNAQPAGHAPRLRLEWTLFSTKLSDQAHHVPLVRFHELGLEIGDDWWR